jgi:serine/threonine-protein kinase
MEWEVTPGVESYLRQVLHEATGSEETPPEVSPWLGDPSRRTLDYVLVTLLGEGGTARVWKAWDLKLARWVAVKIPSLAPGGRDEDRFLREAMAGARLSHPNIVPVFRVERDSSGPLIVMMFIEGRTLADRKLQPARAMEVVRTAAEAVQHAHDRGVVHRDIKPGNLMLDEEGRVWVLDFGLAYLLDRTGSHTTRGVVFGTAPYMSPEQAAGDRRGRDPATDIYSLGATLYELATGKPPFSAGEPSRVLSQIIHGRPEPPRKLDPGVPEDLETVILKAMEKEPRHRYHTAGELAEDLARCIKGRPVAARRRVAWDRMARAAFWTLVVIFALAAGGWSLRTTHMASDARAEARESLREVARVTLDAALQVRRAGDYQGMKGFLPRLEAAYRKTAGDAEVEYIMARALRGLMEETRALSHALRALELEPEHAPALYEKVLLESMRYREEYLRVAMRIEGELPSQADVENRNPGLLRMAESIRSDCSRLESFADRAALDPPQALAARGIYHYFRGQIESGIACLEKAVERDPYLEEAWWFLGESHVRCEDLDQGEKCFRAAIERDKGYYPHWLSLGRLLTDRGADRDDIQDWREAERCFNHALKLVPDNVEARAGRGCVRVNLGIDLADRRRDPSGMLDSAEQDLLESARLGRENHKTWEFLGNLSAFRAAHAEKLGKDPTPDYESSLHYYSESIRCDPRCSDAWTRMGSSWMWIGIRRRSIPDLKRAIECLDRALSFNRAEFKAWIRRAEISERLGDWKRTGGADPTAEYESAECDLTEALFLAPADGTTHFRRGRVRAKKAGALQARGDRHLWCHWAICAHDLERAMKLKPALARSVGPWLEKARIECGR